MAEQFQDMKELIEELREDKMLTRDQAFVLFGRLGTLFELGQLDSEETKTLRGMIPLTNEDVFDIRV